MSSAVICRLDPWERALAPWAFFAAAGFIIVALVSNITKSSGGFCGNLATYAIRLVALYPLVTTLQWMLRRGGISCGEGQLIAPPRWPTWPSWLPRPSFP
jgi:hypothetical protein